MLHVIQSKKEILWRKLEKGADRVQKKKRRQGEPKKRGRGCIKQWGP